MESINTKIVVWFDIQVKNILIYFFENKLIMIKI